MRTPEGSTAIDQLRVGDYVLSRNEHSRGVGNSVNNVRRVEQIFVLSALIVKLTVGGKLIETTAEHPFFVLDRGWVAAGELQPGDRIQTMDHSWINVDSIRCTDETKTVYNMRVEIDHTYFVGDLNWNFAVWVHNDYKPKSLQNGKFGVELDDNGTLYKDPSTQQVKEFNTQEQAQQFIDNGLVESSPSNNNNAPPASTPVGNDSAPSPIPANINIIVQKGPSGDTQSGQGVDILKDANSRQEESKARRQRVYKYLQDLEYFRETISNTEDSIHYYEKEIARLERRLSWYFYFGYKEDERLLHEAKNNLSDMFRIKPILLEREQEILGVLNSPENRSIYEGDARQKLKDLLVQKRGELTAQILDYYGNIKARDEFDKKRSISHDCWDYEQSLKFDKKAKANIAKIQEIRNVIVNLSIDLNIPLEQRKQIPFIVHDDTSDMEYTNWFNKFIGKTFIETQIDQKGLAELTDGEVFWSTVAASTTVVLGIWIGSGLVISSAGRVIGQAMIYRAVATGAAAGVAEYLVYNGAIYITTSGKSNPPTTQGAITSGLVGGLSGGAASAFGTIASPFVGRISSILSNKVTSTFKLAAKNIMNAADNNAVKVGKSFWGFLSRPFVKLASNIASNVSLKKVSNGLYTGTPEELFNEVLEKAPWMKKYVENIKLRLEYGVDSIRILSNDEFIEAKLRAGIKNSGTQAFFDEELNVINLNASRGNLIGSDLVHEMIHFYDFNKGGRFWNNITGKARNIDDLDAREFVTMEIRAKLAEFHYNPLTIFDEWVSWEAYETWLFKQSRKL